jgi:hypothetical protein
MIEALLYCSMVGSAAVLSCQHWWISPAGIGMLKRYMAVNLMHIELLQPPLETEESNTWANRKQEMPSKKCKTDSDWLVSFGK